MIHLPNDTDRDQASGDYRSGRLLPPRSWSVPEEHFVEAIENPWFRSIFQLQAQFVVATFNFFSQRNILPALMPVTCQSVSSPMGLGSDSVPVSIRLHGKETFLADSMQFHLEFILRHSQSGVFYIMPTFRGEEPDRTHLNEFFHSEVEIRGTLDDIMSLVNEYITHCSRHLLETSSVLIASAAGTTKHLEDLIGLSGHVPEITFRDALEMLADDPEALSELPGGARTISRHGEMRLMKEVSPFLWLKHPEHRSVPFYQAWLEDGVHARSADFLLGVGEVVGCGERHIDETSTRRALSHHGVDSSPYAWYLRMKRDYPLQSSGFGLGIERYLAWVLRHDDIRDLQIIPRLKGVDTSL